MKKILAVILLTVSALLITACKSEGTPASTTEKPETTCNHVEVLDAGTAATCTESGMTDGSHCSICGATIKEQTVIQPTGHSFGEWAEIKAATCTEAGEQEHTCATCGHTEKQEIEALGHALPEEWTTDVAATCIQVGQMSKTCTRCGEKVETAEIPMTEHVIVTDPAVAATCTKSGLSEGKHCSVCNTVITAQKKTTASHKYSDYKCSSCGKIQDGHQVDYLRNWTMKNGTVDGEFVRYRSYVGNYNIWSMLAWEYEYNFKIAWTDLENDEIVVTSLFPENDPTGGTYYCAVVVLEPVTENEILMVEFLISPQSFTKNSPITVIDYDGDISGGDVNTAAEYCRVLICQLLDQTKTELKRLNIGMTLADLGFTAYK